MFNSTFYINFSLLLDYRCCYKSMIIKAFFLTMLDSSCTKDSVQKPYWIGLVFTHKNKDFGMISETEQSCRALEYYQVLVGSVRHIGTL